MSSKLLRSAEVLAPELAPYLRGCTQEMLVVPRCNQCGHYQFPPRSLCRVCGHDTFAWTQIAGRGSLYSWTTTHRVSAPEFRPITPYTVVVVSLDLPEELRMVGRLRQTGIVPDLHIGDAMTCSFETLTNGDVLAVWSPR